MFDINQNGRISVEEITQVFRDYSLHLTKVNRLIEIFDTNGDGTITFDEWFAALKPQRAFQGAEPNERMTMEQ